MKTHKAYRFRIYPKPFQEVLIAKTIGCSRFVFNHFPRSMERYVHPNRKRLKLHEVLKAAHLKSSSPG